MNKIVFFTALLAYTSAAPGHYYDLHDYHNVYDTYHTISSPSKTTITKNSHAINHGGHEIVHAPLYDAHALLHEPVHVAHEPVHALHEYKEPATSSQYFRLENKKYQLQKVSSVPVLHETPVLLHSAELGRTGDSAVSHHSSTSYETQHQIYAAPLYDLYHH